MEGKEEDEGPREKMIRTAVGEKPLTGSAAVTRSAAVTHALYLRPRRATRKATLADRHLVEVVLFSSPLHLTIRRAVDTRNIVISMW